MCCNEGVLSMEIMCLCLQDAEAAKAAGAAVVGAEELVAAIQVLFHSTGLQYMINSAYCCMLCFTITSSRSYRVVMSVKTYVTCTGWKGGGVIFSVAARLWGYFGFIIQFA
jgi:hypothetical protein